MKPREWWIHFAYGDKTETEDWDDDDPGSGKLVQSFNKDEFYTLYATRPMENGVHVVEHSAYQKAVDALKELHALMKERGVETSGLRHGKTTFFKIDQTLRELGELY